MSVTAPAGFVAAGVPAGIKASGAPDLALVATADHRAVPAAAVFTTNRAEAAPVRLSRSHLRASGGRAGAVLCNSGNANAATGAAGLQVGRRCGSLLARALGLQEEGVLLCSTGLIGIPMDPAPIELAIPGLVAGASADRDAGAAAAGAILTTDTRPKQVVVAGEGWSVGGMAKGAAMLAPSMATMLAVLTTDASTDPACLDRALRRAAGATFNELSVDGCCSTNDTVIVLASGLGAAPTESQLTDALTAACEDLASQMLADAEGATKVVTVMVTGAAGDAEAARAAWQVCGSQLVQASLHGGDPYWGRVVAELGAAGVAFELDRTRVAYGGIVVCRDGTAADHDGAALALHMAGREVLVEADLGLGRGRARMRTTDLSPAYVELNATTS
ncbi:MAG: bifunctional glutamate N-acetyltransferase/amino-acid acetyltransferase ArgJ [Acidimicrobiales bacterium]